MNKKLTELEQEAANWLNGTDTMQFSQVELLSMFAEYAIKTMFWNAIDLKTLPTHPVLFLFESGVVITDFVDTETDLDKFFNGSESSGKVVGWAEIPSMIDDRVEISLDALKKLKRG